MTRLILLFAFILAGAHLKAQCLSRQVMWDTFQQHQFSLSDPKLLPYLYSLRESCYECGYQKDSLEARLDQIIGQTYYQLLQLDSAKKYTRNAIQIIASGGPGVNAGENVKNYYQLGAIEKKSGNRRATLTALNRCIALAQKYPEQSGFAASAYQTLAGISYETGQLEDCGLQARLGELHAQSSGLVNTRIDLLMWQVRSLFALHQTEEAEQLLAQTKKIAFASSSPATIAHFSQLAGTLMCGLSRKDEAIQYYEKARVALAPHLAHRYAYAEICTQLGDLFLSHRQNKEKALWYFHQSFNMTGDLRKKATIAQKIAEVNLLNHRIHDALSYYQKGLQLLIPGFSPEKLADNPDITLLQKATKKPELFVLLTQKGYAWADSAGSTPHRSAGRDGLFSHALESYLLADRMLDFMLWENDEPDNYWKNLTAGLYQNAVQSCLLSNQSGEALYFIERNKFFQLRDRFGPALSFLNLNPTETEQYHQVSREITRYRTLVEADECNGKDLIAFNSQLTRQLDTRRNLILGHVVKAPFLRHYQNKNNKLTLSQLRNLVLKPMGDSSAYLTFLEGDREVYGLLVTTGAARLRKIPKEDYQKTSSDFLSLLKKKSLSPDEYQRFLAVSNKFYKTLLAPFSLRDEKRLIVSPAGPLIPLEALSTSDKSPEYLIKKLALSYTYSTLFLNGSDSKQRDFAFNRNYIGLAPNDFSTNHLVDGTKPEVDKIETVGHMFFLPRVYTGSKASAKTFLKKAPLYRVVQLTAPFSNPSESPGIQFSDSLLKLSSLHSRGFNTQLLILNHSSADIDEDSSSVCSSFDIARRFSAMGVSSVIASIWPSEEAAENEHTAAFYQNLKRGLPLDLALQNAKIEWLEKNSTISTDPHTWTGLILVGNATPVATDKEINGGLLLGLTILLVTAYITFVYQKRAIPQEP